MAHDGVTLEIAEFLAAGQVVAVSDDGTFAEVAAGHDSSTTPMGIIALNTTNVMSQGLGDDAHALIC